MGGWDEQAAPPTTDKLYLKKPNLKKRKKRKRKRKEENVCEKEKTNNHGLARWHSGYRHLRQSLTSPVYPWDHMVAEN